MTAKPPQNRPDRHKKLAEALRANLKRRKAHANAAERRNAGKPEDAKAGPRQPN